MSDKSIPDPGQLERIREMRPLLHCISNLVSANDCANLALAIGASPMMAQAPEEMEEITELSNVTVLNTGTPDRERFDACGICGRAAARLGQPVILDPVGAGASRWRLRKIRELLDDFPVFILRVNYGEAEALAWGHGREQGVDSIQEADIDARIRLAGRLAERYGTTVLLTGKEDLVHDGKRVFTVEGGSSRTSSVTGTGCMLSVLCGAFAAVETDAVSAAALASAFWKRCAEQAEREAAARGMGDFHLALMNAAGSMTPGELRARGNIRRISPDLTERP